MTAARVSFGTRSVEHDGGAHVTVTVWAGAHGGTRAFCGTLTMRPDEATELVERLGDRTPDGPEQ